jgi:putative FmdB family regulatory protein
MPIYEYECRRCGHRFEYLVLSSTPAAKCPACNKKDLEQLISLSMVSSQATRQAHLSAARKRADAVRMDKQYEDAKELREHYEDHVPPAPPKKKKK